jgi:dipeptidyl aminopeptidase/acylaminoacyl peptidase
VFTAPDVPASVVKSLPRADGSLVPRRTFFENPDRGWPQISPDGKNIAYASNVDGVLNVWVGRVDDAENAKAVTQDKKRGIRFFRWSAGGDRLLYVQDKNGDENFHLYSVDLRTAQSIDLTPFEGVQARLEKISPRQPREVLVGINDRDKRYHDLYRVNVNTGDRKLVQKNEGYSAFYADEDYHVHLGARPRKDGGVDYMIMGKKPEVFAALPMEDVLTTEPIGFDKDARTLFMKDSRGRDTSALVAVDMRTKKASTLLTDPRADIDDVMLHPTERRVQAAFSDYDRRRWQFVDNEVKADFDALKQVAEGEIEIRSRSHDDQRWIVAFIASDAPVKFHLWDRASKKSKHLFASSKALEKVPLKKMTSHVIKARDGLDLVSYLTAPSDKPGPMVLLVHGGPWGRDHYGMVPTHQWLASRGYAVLSVNFRGSTGFGKRFVNAGNKEWAGKMQDDLLDAADWAVAQKIADKDKIAIMGGSYGGYATLVGLSFTPEKFACGVDIVGPSNLVTLLSSIPPYWESEIEQFTLRIGDHRTEEGKKLLLERSPLPRADKIARPLLIGQGANDPRVKQAEADQIVKAMYAKKIPVTYVLYGDEGHGFVRPENRTSFNAVADVFLAQCLGGAYQPVGDDFKGSSITVPSGVEHVFGIKEALPK